MLLVNCNQYCNYLQNVELKLNFTQICKKKNILATEIDLCIKKH